MINIMNNINYIKHSQLGYNEIYVRKNRLWKKLKK